VLEGFKLAGGIILEQWQPAYLIPALREALPDLPRWSGGEALRIGRWRRDGRDFLLVANEGETRLEGALNLPCTGNAELWDPLNARTYSLPARQADGRMEVNICLDRRETIVLMFGESTPTDALNAAPPQPGKMLLELRGPWSAKTPNGGALNMPAPGDWAQAAGMETFTGTIVYETTFELTEKQARAAALLDLGCIGDIAEVAANRKALGVRAWAPYRFDVVSACREGRNELRVAVTNSMANMMDGLQMPSGLMWPVRLLAARQRQ
jgi:hypothetical protein